ncbi:hypothetical protein [Agromyces arachidis]|uniref:hypothetical protein n=1 Tax=Agromyces arachidis TaxID=766966 RepID=UPI0040568116
MSDPLNPWENQDRLGPAGDLNPRTPDLTGVINTVGSGLGIGGHGDAMLDPETADREAQDARQTAAGGVGDTGPEPTPGAREDTDRDTDPDPDANDLEADNPVEQETIETVDPDNPPA